MYKRIKSMLVSPKEIVQYTNDKTRRVFCVLLCYVLLLSIPGFIVAASHFGLDASKREIIMNAFSQAEPVEFQIIDEKLVADNYSIRPSANILIKELDMLIVFDPEYEFKNEANMGLEYMYCIVFTEEEVKIALASNHALNIPVCDYSMFDKYVDFKDAQLITNNDFWIRIFSAANEVINKYKVYYLVAVIIALLIQNIFTIAFSTLILMVFMRFVDGSKSWLYTKTYKMALYCYLPCVIGSLLSTLFGNYFLYLIGFMISTVYGFIVARLMALSKIKN